MRGETDMLFKQYMKVNRWSYLTLAEALNVSRLTIANWDKGVTSPNLGQVELLCKLLEVEPKELIINFIEMREREQQNGKQL
jgi:transcriptional regulator with XRE-family HTH domain